MAKTVAERLWAKVQRGPGCWLWTGAFAAGDRYGAIRIEGKNYRVHRVAYELTKGAIPEGMVVRHRCANTLCCRPSHLLVGTHKQNMADMKRHKHGWWQLGYSSPRLRPKAA